MRKIHKLAPGAGATVALIASSFAISPATATPGSGISVSPVVNGQFGTIDQNAGPVGNWNLHVKSTDATDVGSDKLTLQPGGYTGWHNHPAPVFVTVTKGTIQWFDGSDPICAWKSYTAGQSFIEPALRTHNARNPTDHASEFIAIRLNPTGVPFRTDQSEPNNCHHGKSH